MIQYRLSELAARIGGTQLGDADLFVDGLHALGGHTLSSLCPLFQRKVLATLIEDGADLPAAVLASGDMADWAVERGVRGAIVCPDPPVALSRLIDLFYPPKTPPSGIDPSAIVHQTASVASSARIGAGAVLENETRIGERSVVGPGAVVGQGTVVGSDVVIGPGAVIGGDGFGFLARGDAVVKVRQVGRVVVEDNVEIGANVCIDRGTLGVTRIGSGSKIDNLVQIGHNVSLGRNVIIAAQTGIAGSTVVGDGAMLGGQVGIADHLEIGANARIAAKSGVIGDVASATTVAGYPAVDRVKWLRAVAGSLKTEE